MFNFLKSTPIDKPTGTNLPVKCVERHEWIERSDGGSAQCQVCKSVRIIDIEKYLLGTMGI